MVNVEQYGCLHDEVRSKEYVTRQAIYYVESDIACMQKPMKDADKSGVSILLH